LDKLDRKDRKPVINVHDTRTLPDPLKATETPGAKTVQVNKDGIADMSLDFRNVQSGVSNQSNTETSYMEKNDGKQGQSFASMLSGELRNNAADFVKTGSIVLRDNNSGLIRLSLHPESLGNVKISMELSDKKITGKIICSSREAYEAFNENLDGLSDAFVKGGFESAGFDLSWSGDNPSGRGQQERQGHVSSPFYASSIPEVMSAPDIADTRRSGYRFSDRSAVNFFA
jgi:flagellar hook-length control protein FliK